MNNYNNNEINQNKTSIDSNMDIQNPELNKAKSSKNPNKLRANFVPEHQYSLAT